MKGKLQLAGVCRRVVMAGFSQPASRNKSSKHRLLDMVDGNPRCESNLWRRNRFLTGASGPFPPGNPFAPCLRSGKLVSKATDQGEKIVDGGKSLAKKAGSAANDAIDPVF